MVSLHNCSECVFPVDDGWVDDTGYVFQNGKVRVVMGPFCPIARWAGKLEKAAEHFRVAAPAYELVDWRPVDRPTAGAELFAHRFGGILNCFELSVFWPIGESMWVFRATAPIADEEFCWRSAEKFLQSYQPIEPIEAVQ
jgi:hypothetical protein